MESSELQNHLSTGARFGRLVRKKRLAEKLSRNQLAADTQLSHTSISRLERGDFADIGLATTARLVQRLSISVDELNLVMGCTLTGDLLDLDSYLQAAFPAWPERAVHAAANYCTTLDERFSKEQGGGI